MSAIRVIESYKRLNNSVNGNPRYRITFHRWFVRSDGV